MNQKRFYSWEELTKDVDKLAKQLEVENLTLRNIYGIPRGGLVIAVMLSHRLDIPLIFSQSKVGKHTLIVDDISDSGKTLSKILKPKKFQCIATLHTKIDTLITPDYYVETLTDNSWIVYPWETEQSSKYDNE